ncbi:calcium-translocating P-type ATPase, PMCA-type [Paracoccidioides lutzii Pb01]|uniref:Calcium-transporting ATPase n=1 Tax=Paracoccidioides lutzii (strain ATCC MYA-826 / Pb01) TaxID=502779 RepID=A0A0A2VJ88_PARBA|nr:calcium-translocating P-type ATPase, PMCA-type [Paracoccidioides lutzii Pb01]KGQ00979.1 calcium-translocating P-type ATPase, PMCA-type [Paracoccidioides lutzii Pb01]
MANNNRLLAPPILVNTSQIDQSSSDSRSINEDAISRNNDSSLLLAPNSPASYDGETLRSRSGSFLSNVETLRSRAGSTAHSVPGKGDYDDVPLSEALNPDQRNEKDFQVENNPFAFSPGQLNKMLNPKSLNAFVALGGLHGLERGLRTNLTSGLSIDETKLEGTVTFDEATKYAASGKYQPVFKHELAKMPTEAGFSVESQFVDRLRVYQSNKLPEREADGFLVLLWRAYNDKIIILLTIAAVVSLSLGLYETFSGGSPVDWIEGVAICVAILIVTLVTALNDWQKERQFVKLNRKKNDRQVKVIRSGKSVMISVYDITVGDILHMEPGDAIPADGIFLSGHGVKCDESSATGESDQMKKTSGYEVWQRIMDGSATKKLDPFIISGSKVLEGVGTYLVTSVGPNSTYGKIMMSLHTPNDPTPLQVKLGRLANWIGGVGTGAAVVLFTILLIRFLVQLPSNPASPAAKGSEFLNILIVAVTVIVVAIPEGLPLAVTLALAFATKRMVKENNLVRILRACETMGNATVICSDKTGTLTQNKMTVVAGTLGIEDSFNQASEDGEGVSNMTAKFKGLSPTVRDLLVKGIALNSTAFEGEEKGQRTFIGSKTEVAMLNLARNYLALNNLAQERSNAYIVQLIPFDSARKCMGVVVRQPSGDYRLHVKGAAEILLSKASKVISITNDNRFALETLSESSRNMVLDTITAYSKRSLRNIGMVYKDFESWPPAGAKTMEDDNTLADFDNVFHDMNWVGVVGIQDPLRPEVPAAIQKCNNAGVSVKMVTGDNITTAVAIATECGIKTPDGIAMEGPKFRQLSDEEMDKILPNLQVLARSSPEDKRILVARLKHLGETVAVTGDGTNDGPALKTADVGFSMGIASTEVAKEASSIILLDDNFKSIVTAISWGRAVNDAVAKFLQFQITVNITAVCLTFVSSVSSSRNQSVLRPVQLLWVNLIMDTFAALALATDAPTDKILNRKPTPKSAPLFTTTMWKMIIGQSIYQLAVTYTLFFGGARIFNYDTTNPIVKQQLDTIVFNTFVWMQIFNEFNNRRLDNNFNIFEDILKNYYFISINCLMFGGQVMIIFVGGEALSVRPITGVQWAISIGCAIMCIPFAILIRCFPDPWFKVIFDGVMGTVAAILKPISKGFSFVFAPVKNTTRAFGRFFSRISSKISRRKAPADGEQDEEAAAGLEAKTHPTVAANPAVPAITLSVGS